jgi:hypothetical protein
LDNPDIITLLNEHLLTMTEGTLGTEKSPGKTIDY